MFELLVALPVLNDALGARLNDEKYSWWNIIHRQTAEQESEAGITFWAEPLQFSNSVASASGMNFGPLIALLFSFPSLSLCFSLSSLSPRHIFKNRIFNSSHLWWHWTQVTLKWSRRLTFVFWAATAIVLQLFSEKFIVQSCHFEADISFLSKSMSFCWCLKKNR